MSRLYVGNISSKGSIDELKQIFEKIGELKSFNIKDGAGYIVKLTI